jgi:nucleotidyltransferase/DNA polymerase involved in DNA repair
MVDSAINWLFVDLNSYFASIEQELRPELRGQPIAIVPIRVEAQTGCCIAVSYQAKAYGVKTGSSVADAKPAFLSAYRHRWRSSTTPPINCARQGGPRGYPSIRSSQSAAENVNVYLRPTRYQRPRTRLP